MKRQQNLIQLGVFGKFLAISISTCMVVFVLCVTLFIWSNYRDGQIALEAKLDALAEAYALILAEPLSSQRYDQIESYSQRLLVDKDVAGFLITDALGNELQKFGVLDPEAVFVRTSIIPFANQAGIDRTGLSEAGQIRLVMNTETIDSRVSQQIRVITIMAGGLLLVALLCTGLAYWRAVGIPLQRLTSEIRRFQKEGNHIDIAIHTEDQLGEVIREYNRMQNISSRQREKLLEQQRGLEQEVTNRTEELEQILEKHAKTSERLAYLAIHDSLTELPNRRAFQEHVSMWMINLGETGDKGALCYINLDRLKAVNDTSGYHAGDAFLVSVSKLLELSVGEHGYLARLGGDEFALFLKGADEQEASEYCRALIQTVTEHKFEWAGELYGVGLSIGISMIDTRSVSYDQVLKNADVASDVAKCNGGNCLHVYFDEIVS